MRYRPDFSITGPSQFARYRAGPGIEAGGAGMAAGLMGDPSGDDPHSFSSAAAVYGYDHFVVPEVKREHPDWSPIQVTREALTRFNLRFSENIASLQGEQNGKSSVMIWREELHDGERMLVVHGGKYDGYTLDRLWSNTAQYDQDSGMRLAANREELKAQRRVQRAILDGEATSSASIIGHPESVKLIQTFHRGSDGLYYSEQIDLEGLTGRKLTFSEGKTVMAALYQDHQRDAKTTDAHHDHFMVARGIITASEVKTISQAIVLTSREAQPLAEQAFQSEKDTQISLSSRQESIRGDAGVLDGIGRSVFMDTSHIVFRDSGEAIKGIAAFLRDKEKRKEAVDRLLGLSVVQRIRRIFGRGEESLRQKYKEKTGRPEVRVERLTIAKIREKPVRMVEIIKKQHEEMKKGMAMLGVIAETGVAIHAAPVILVRLKEKLPTPVVAMKKSIERHAKKELRRKKRELRKAKQEPKKDFVKVLPLRSERVEPFRAAKERKKRRKLGKEIGVKKVAAAELLTPIASERRKGREKRRLQRVVEKSVRRHKKKESRRVQPLIEKKRSIQKKEREAVAGMVFGWMVWMMLHNAKKTGLHPARIQSEALNRKYITKESEPALSVLLSIIWYLTAIREHAMRNNPINQSSNTTNTTKKKTWTTRQTIPKQGIIFLFAS